MDARETALGWLDRKPLTRAEVRKRLAEEGVPREEVEEVLAGLERDGHLDDRRLSEHWISTRHGRLRLGEERLVGELVKRGVDEEVARGAWADLVGAGDLDPGEALRREAERRARAEGIPLNGRAWRRVYNALLRAGHPPDAVQAALAPLRDENPDDLA